MRHANTNSGEATAIGGQVIYLASGEGTGELTVNRASYGSSGRGARVAFTIADSPFGRILIASTKTGVCWLGICDSDSRLEAELRTDLSAAEISLADLPTVQTSRDDNGRAAAKNSGVGDGLTGLARTVVDYISGRTREIALPIDIRATPFQIAVWRELCAIPRGTTRSYGEIARRLGRPEASRAVGHANGSNPLAIIIPCHRAIGADGSLTGYRWGLEYKRRLLDHESALVQTSLAFG